MRLVLLSTTFLLGLIVPGLGQEPLSRLKVGIFERPPLAMKDTHGHWIGVAVDLWENVSKENGFAYEYVEVTLSDIVPKLQNGELDLALGEISVSADRERKVDFTQPFLVTSLAAAVLKDTSFANWRQILYGITHHGLLPVVAGMMALLVFFSFLLWLLERRTSRSHYPGRRIDGLGSALWFTAVTMTTVGYGDKTPHTTTGRVVAFLWMFLGILLVSAFTGSVSSSIMLAQLSASIREVEDLTRFRNGVLRGSLAQTILTESGIPAKKFDSYQAGLQAVDLQRITAFEGDSITLRYLVQRDFPTRLKVVTFSGTHVTFAIATRQDFPAMETLNVSILSLIATPEWSRKLQQWLGGTAGID